MSDARWFEVDSDIDAAIGHFRKSVALHQKAASAIQGSEVRLTRIED